VKLKKWGGFEADKQEKESKGGKEMEGDWNDEEEIPNEL
jgi:hypothetical protein